MSLNQTVISLRSGACETRRSCGSRVLLGMEAVLGWLPCFFVTCLWALLQLDMCFSFCKGLFLKIFVKSSVGVSLLNFYMEWLLLCLEDMMMGYNSIYDHLVKRFLVAQKFKR